MPGSSTRMRTQKVIFHDFPGGPHGFELVSQFCYNKSNIEIAPSNVVILDHAARYMEMNKRVLGRPNLIEKTEEFLQEIYSWTWHDLLVALQHGQGLLVDNGGTRPQKPDVKRRAEGEKGLVAELVVCSEHYSMFSTCSLQRLVDEVVGRLTLPSMATPSAASLKSASFRSSCDSRSTETSSTRTTFSQNSWWFEDLATFNIELVGMIVRAMLLDKFDHAIISKFLFYYQKIRVFVASGAEKIKTVQKLVDLLFLLDKRAISLRPLFSTLRISLNLELPTGSRHRLEGMIAVQLDQAKLDDLLVPPPPPQKNYTFDVKLILRLSRIFLLESSCKVSLSQLRKVAWLMDLYAAEIAADTFLKPSKFAAVLMALPDYARDSCDRLYHAIDIYFQVHKKLREKHKLRVCLALNYAKLSTEVLIDLARNPNLPLLARYRAKSYWSSKLNGGIKDASRFKFFSNHRGGSRGDSEVPKADLEQMGSTVLELEEAFGTRDPQMIPNVMTPKACCMQQTAKYLPKLCS
ncbi:hypothetical protein Ancab_005050 [Ancistrocladus abbreviatus]